MKNFYTRNMNKIAMIGILVVLVSVLASCRQGTWPTTPYTNWGAEFHFSGFWQGLWGWPVAILSYPIAWLMGTIGGALGDSYAWGIIFTTLIVRTIAWPIYAKQNSTSLKMTLMQPEMQKVQMKYAARKDPESQRRMQQETMAIYKKYKMNPLGCGFTMILQFPIFMAMYECVRRIQLPQILDGTVEVAGNFTLGSTKLFGYFDINTSVMSSGTSGIHQAVLGRDIAFGVILAILYAVVTLFSQKLAQRPPKYQKRNNNRVKTEQQISQEKTMKIMNYVMVGMFFFMALSSTALTLYWFIGALYQVFQSQVGRKLNERAYYKAKEKHNII